MSAYNPSINGGTIYVGIDLPGGTGSPANGSFTNDSYGAVTARGQPLPFDADGNGEADFIGRLVDGVTPFSACPGPAGAMSDIWSCSPMSESAGAIDDPRGGFLGEMEFYNVTIGFGTNQQARAIFTQENTTAANQADLVIVTPQFGVIVSSDTGGTGVPQGFDVLFAITNVNNVVTNECDRLNQSVTVRSGSNSDGSGQGEDVNSLVCVYNLPAGIAVTKQCPTTNAAPGTLLVFTGTVTNTGQVTLTNVTVLNNQPTNNTPVLGPISLAPGTAVNFTNSYLIPLNFNNCQITDTLTVTGNHACTNVVVTNTATASCLVSNTPLIRVTKTCPPTNAVPGSLLVFSGTVSNAGTLTLTNVTVVNTQPTNNTPVFGPGTLVPGQSINFTGSYLVPTNVNACFITDTLTATGTDICIGSNVTHTAVATCLVSNTTLIRVTKSCPPTNAVPGSVLFFSGTVSNAGTITLTNVTVVNNQPTNNTPIFGPVMLLPGQVASFSGNYLVPATNACSVTDTLTATGTDICIGSNVTHTATATCLISNTPLIRVTKSCPPTNAVPGSLLVFSGTVSNAGTLTLTNVVVVNNQPTNNAPVFGPVTLLPGQVASFSGNYLVAANTNACSVTDTLTATGTENCLGSNVIHTATATCLLSNTPLIRVTKSCPPTNAVPGSLLVFSGTVSNAGTLTLTNVVVVNNQPTNNAPVFGPVTLLPGQVASFNGNYLVPANTNACAVTDTLTATGTENCLGSNVIHTATATCLLSNTPLIRVTKSCPPTNAVPGSLLVFSGTVSNAGTITLTNVVVVNNQPTNNAPVFGPVTLLPGQVASFSGNYLVPANTNACAVTDTLTATGTENCLGSNVTHTATATCLISNTPLIRVTKTCPPTNAVPGTLLVFSGTVSNAGTLTLTNVVVVNNQPTNNAPVFGPVMLLPGQVASFSGNYLVPANTNACSVTDTLTATGTEICLGSNVTHTATAACLISNTPLIRVTKTCPPTNAVPGSLLVFSGTVSNAGTLTLTNVVVVNNQPTNNAPVFGPVTLLAGQSTNFTGSYLVPTNFSDCGIVDTVTAIGTDICIGSNVTHTATAICLTSNTALIRVTKACPPTNAVPGSVLVFSGTVSNAGTITLTNVTVVNDRPTNNTPVFGPVTLLPGQSTNFTGNYLVPTNVNFCSIADTLTATGAETCLGSNVIHTATATCLVSNTPLIRVTKTCPPTNAVPGSLLVFSGTVSNAGTITLTNVVVVNNQPTNNAPVFGPVTLLPGQVASFSGNYLVPANTNACAVTDTLTATGTEICLGSNVTHTATATCLISNTPLIRVTKTCPPTNAVPGTLLVFSGTVSNAGTLTLTNVVVVNNQPTNNAPVFGPVTLLVGQSTNFTGSYLVPTNFNDCGIADTVTATGTDICIGSNVTHTATAICLMSNTALIRVTKACPPTNAVPGSVLLFSGTVSNAGTITLTNVTVVNDRPTNNTPVFGPVTLLPGQSTNFTGNYLVPTNVNFCSIADTLTATGAETCLGSNITHTATATCLVSNTPLIRVTKLCPTEPVLPGGIIIFSGTVSNAGTITLTNVIVVNSQPTNNTPVFGPVSLPPGQSMTFTGIYLVPITYNGCTIADTLTATGQDACLGSNVTHMATATCLVTNTPLIRVTKSCPPTNAVPGSLLVFSGTVSNAGTITLTNVTVVNNQPTNNTPVFGPVTLVPGQSTAFTGSYPVATNACDVTDTVTARGRDVCTGSNVTHTATATCLMSNTPLIRVTKVCPPDAVAPGGTLMFSGTVSNAGPITLTNVTVVNDRPTNNTPVFGPVTLLPGQSQAFVGSYPVPTNHPDCFIQDTLVAVGVDICRGSNVTDTATATCLLTNRLRVTLFCPTNNIIPPVDDQMTSTNPICVQIADNLPISFLKATLTNVPAGYVVTNGMYPGWCVDYAAVLDTNQIHKPILYVAHGLLPPHLQNTNWNKINYILNHKQGSGKDIQGAIWHFIGGPVPPDDPDGYFPPSATTSNIVADAEANGCDFVPGIGDILAVILDIPDFNGERIQRNIIEVLCPTNVNLCIGNDAEICALATGTGPFTYMWFKDNVVIPNQTNSCLALTNVMVGTNNYCVKVTGFCGEATNCVPVIVNDCPGVIGPIKLMSLAKMPTGAFKITLQGQLGRTYSVEGSEDLLTWRAVATGLVNTDGTLEFSDSAATTKFYRVFMEP